VRIKKLRRPGCQDLWGFTLIELLVVTAVFTLLVTAGVPSLVRFVERQQAESAADSFQRFVTFARAEALVRGRNLVICPRQLASVQCDNTAAADDAEEADIWRQGWLVFVDYDGDPLSVGADDLVLRVQDALDDDLGMLLRGNTGPGYLQYIRMTRSGGSHPLNPSVLFCLQDGSGIYYAAKLLVFRGRVRQSDPDQAREECSAESL